MDRGIAYLLYYLKFKISYDEAEMKTIYDYTLRLFVHIWKLVSSLC